MIKRELYLKTWDDLIKEKPMIFLSGPRQTGKTTLAKNIAENFTNSLYFNYDLPESRRKLAADPLFFEKLDRKDTSTPLVVLDEVHKNRRWKNYLKGVYDGHAGKYKFLVLGSGRLNIFQKGGDSLAGRYFLFYLWPFTAAELLGRNRPFPDFMRQPLFLEAKEDAETFRTWEALSATSGFPEPFTSGRQATYRRWARNYGQQLIREDIRNMTDVKRIDDMEIMFSLLPSKVAQPLSLESLARDLKVSFHSIKLWLSIFERFFLVFTISPWSKKISRAITREKKAYLFDYARIEPPAARFENMVAVELWRAVNAWNDLGLGDFSLHYVRNKEKQEVDFLIAGSGKPLLLVEAKSGDEEASKVLKKFQNILRVPAVQLVDKPGIYRVIGNNGGEILIASAPLWLAGLP